MMQHIICNNVSRHTVVCQAAQESQRTTPLVHWQEERKLDFHNYVALRYLTKFAAEVGESTY